MSSRSPSTRSRRSCRRDPVARGARGPRRGLPARHSHRVHDRRLHRRARARDDLPDAGIAAARDACGRSGAASLSVHAQFLKLVLDLRNRNGLTVLFISHNLGVIEEIADRVGVMYGGQLMVGANEIRKASMNSGFAPDIPIGFPIVGPRFARRDRAAPPETVRDVAWANQEPGRSPRGSASQSSGDGAERCFTCGR
jgi:hypothetical protein